jgi:hypothetical protein
MSSSLLKSYSINISAGALGASRKQCETIEAITGLHFEVIFQGAIHATKRLEQ